MRIEPWWRFFFFDLSIFSVMCKTQTTVTSTICNYYVIVLCLSYWGFCFDLYWSFAGLEIIGHLCGNHVKDFCRNERFALNSYAVFLSGRDKPFAENNCKYEAIKFLSYLFHSLFHGVWLLKYFKYVPAEEYPRCTTSALVWRPRAEKTASLLVYVKTIPAKEHECFFHDNNLN